MSSLSIISEVKIVSLGKSPSFIYLILSPSPDATEDIFTLKVCCPSPVNPATNQGIATLEASKSLIPDPINSTSSGSGILGLQ